MCTVDIDQWLCRKCFGFIEITERIPSWKTCDIGPTYDRACPAFSPNFINHFNFECDACKRAAAAAEKQKTEGKGVGSSGSSTTLLGSSPMDPKLEKEGKGDN
ncbi:hypothetical protein PG996_006300 [Apiospora saccharicola]|uniref:Uncharacterized protein n=1 Tax=Apiospora saccharicola TaxID=335842 RepID=A0ABR1VQ03_9PEZI